MIVWPEKLFNILMGCLFILFGLVSFVVLLPVILISLICLLTPPPFTMIVNLFFPLFFFMGPNGAQICLDRLMTFVRFILDKAARFFRTARTL